MTPDVLSRVGEPFFTTKSPGEGMGLGLFLTRALAEQLGGDFHITSRPGSRTEAFRPAGAHGRREEHRMNTEANLQTLPNILLVDDDEVLRERLATAIRARGYEVRTAGSSDEALREVAKESPEMAVLDLRMPAAGASSC